MDPRTRRSRAALEAALRELIVERDLPRISISEVTKRAGVNRSTFYEHYTDLAELADCACTALFDELVATAPLSDRGLTADGGVVPNPLPRLFAHIAENGHLYRTLLGADGSARVINHLLERITTAARVKRGFAENDDDPAAAFIAGAVLGTVTDWLRRGCPGTPEQMGAAIWPHMLAATSAGSKALGPSEGVAD